MKESEWTRKICKGLEECGALIFAIVGGEMQAPGWPDRAVICHGHTFWLEFKGEKTRVRPLQKIIHRRIADRGGKIFIVRYPGVIENHNEDYVSEFSSPRDLFLQLSSLVEVKRD